MGQTKSQDKSRNKTEPNGGSVDAFIAAIENEQKRADAARLTQIMREETGEEPVMWGDSIVGFGSYHYVYDSGREGDSPKVGFSPRKSNISLYIMSGFEDQDAALGRLGPHKTGKSCLYVRKLADVDEAVLRELIRESVAWAERTYPVS